MGGLTEMAYLSEYDRGYAVMINSGNGKALFQTANLIRRYVVRDLTPPTLPPAASVPIELQQHYGGYYELISPREQWLFPFVRLLNIKRLSFTPDGLTTATHGLRRERWCRSDCFAGRTNRSRPWPCCPLPMVGYSSNLTGELSKKFQRYGCGHSSWRSLQFPC